MFLNSILGIFSIILKHYTVIVELRKHIFHATLKIYAERIGCTRYACKIQLHMIKNLCYLIVLKSLLLIRKECLTHYFEELWVYVMIQQIEMR